MKESCVVVGICYLISALTLQLFERRQRLAVQEKNIYKLVSPLINLPFMPHKQNNSIPILACGLFDSQNKYENLVFAEKRKSHKSNPI
jgi:hypothetical protein